MPLFDPNIFDPAIFDTSSNVHEIEKDIGVGFTAEPAVQTVLNIAKDISVTPGVAKSPQGKLVSLFDPNIFDPNIFDTYAKSPGDEFSVAKDIITRFSKTATLEMVTRVFKDIDVGLLLTQSSHANYDLALDIAVSAMVDAFTPFEVFPKPFYQIEVTVASFSQINVREADFNQINVEVEDVRTL